MTIQNWFKQGLSRGTRRKARNVASKMRKNAGVRRRRLFGEQLEDRRVLAAFVDWASPVSGDLDGNLVDLTGVSGIYTYLPGNSNGAILDDQNLSGPDYAAAPGSTNQFLVLHDNSDDWTAEFDSPVENLGVYALGWRGEQGGLQVSFDGAVPTIESGFGNAFVHPRSNFLVLPDATSYYGILSFGTTDTVSFQSDGSAGPVVGVTFADLAAPDAFVVTTLSDEDDGTADSNTGSGTSLREAIAAAEANPNQSTITFDPSLVSGGDASIALDLFDTGLDADEAGPTAFVVNTEIVIQGPSGDNGITIERDSNADDFRLFHVQSAGNLSLQYLTFAGGVARGGDGGDGQTFSAGGGGAAGLGGAILTEGNLKIVSSTVSGNLAIGGNGGGNGGGMIIGNGSGGGGGGGLAQDGSIASEIGVGGDAGGPNQGFGGPRGVDGTDGGHGGGGGGGGAS
ncbi:MAG TPA: hypothetical protein DDW52_22855, partial [Planctomycetaceae bacterium]|nr:hypothetical protein [Planctomycetaceae bacterium]